MKNYKFSIDDLTEGVVWRYTGHCIYKIMHPQCIRHFHLSYYSSLSVNGTVYMY